MSLISFYRGWPPNHSLEQTRDSAGFAWSWVVSKEESELLSSKPLASFRIMLLMKNFDWISEG
jgi:hypothetical protein